MTRLMKIGCLWAAVAAVPVLGLTSSADAQYRLNYDGRANEANNRVGSGGANPTESSNAVSGNDIVTGNVTAGQHFRGNLPYRNAREFRGPSSGGMIDDFVKGSTTVDPNAPGSSYKVQTFYGGARTVDPPAGFTPAPISAGTGGYLPPSETTVHRAIGDQRIGAVNLAQPEVQLPMPGTLMLPGPVDPTAGQQFITATPLTGIRTVAANDPAGLGTRMDTAYNPVTSGRLTPTQIESMQKELSESAGGDATQSTLAPGAVPTVQGATQIKTATPIVQPGVKPLDQAQPINNAIEPAANAGTDQGVRQRLLLPPPQKQSTLYAELLKRHEEAAADRKMSDAEASRAFNAAREQAAKQGTLPGSVGAATPGQPGQPGAAAPGAVTPGAVPGVAPAPGQTATSGAGDVTDFAKKNEERMRQFQEERARGSKKKIEPVKTQSFASGMQGKGLQELMKNAEDLMKDGKFTAALERYEEADRVTASNPNPLIKLARANAELGASFYARSEAHLREVFTTSPALLSGQYDLTTLLGEQRLSVLVKDLKDIMKKEEREPRAAFLLSYIAYNTGRAEQADAYLDLADKRAGGKDPFFKLLRDNWSLPEKPATPANPGLNK